MFGAVSKERIEREGENQRFCPCALARSCPHRSLVEASVRDGLVPACPHEKEKKCGSITQPLAERALNTWLNAGPTRAGAAAEARLSGQKALSKAERKSSLHEWGVRANKVRAHARARENTQWVAVAHNCCWDTHTHTHTHAHTHTHRCRVTDMLCCPHCCGR
jgi:hypothetical protein